MDPVAFQLFGLEIRWYGILIATGVLIGTILALRETKRVGLDEEILMDFLIWEIPLCLVGARLYYVIFSWDFYKDNPIEALNIRNGGLAIHGAIITAIIVAIVFTKIRKIEFWTIADICAPSLILAQSIGRWGNFINQEAHGGPTNLPWGIMVNGIKVHPTFLYESIWNFLVFLFLLWYGNNKQKIKGEVFLLYLSLYSFIRFFIEGLRTDSLMLGPIRVAQLVSIVGFVIPIYIFYRRRKKNEDIKL
ncbi:phosphatidylglycerol:prolipoprotein diacylglycerol transferase [Tissierella praeacuta DSM 18095]|uniref:Phosphatidylglycerol--prolipoprotein diacylglyceryl transferase n=1 Tax=Tissierella praeacuta DSM 18095 TaxID=1123404 RepID=A0A1M4SV49_9FIRM|nr:prolipoprotein diacylglyceryl transferase [Tissierella praeacuta]TCU70710.1 phosphatidylglycerol:prolipoprotein diacylglycerol transferase [Tissierella praeacuta]SHE36068.1 phosphatidylglycerol:prolipoprotein diacylglycerol transferase [Tissierella praeacuta DSM 18095]SUP01795.1 Prolipoprotein diacylglyceryl transferase [Tissierella praeacuta]HAE91792.1 prolipoprotein diacylglyceryl transferase [Tissierella sp.]